MNERLRVARKKAGFETARLAAAALGVPESTYIGHENGNRGFPAKKASRYARMFKTTEEWLLYGKGDAPTGPALPSEAELEAMLESALRELPASATLGDLPRFAASNLRSQLTRFLSDRSDQEGEAPQPQRTNAKPRSPTKRVAPA